MFLVSVFLVGAMFVIAYGMWEVRYVYNLTAGQATGVGIAMLIVILLCVLLLFKACAHVALAPTNRTMHPIAGRSDVPFTVTSQLPSQSRLAFAIGS